MTHKPEDDQNLPAFPEFNNISDILKFQKTPPSIPSELPSSVEEAIDSLDEAKIALICCCFSVMFSEGVTWSEIFQTIASRMPSISEQDQKAIAGLELMGELLTLNHIDFK